MHIDNENNFRQALSEGLNIFLGAGFSLLAKDAERVLLPKGKDLREEIIKRFDLSNVGPLNLSQICALVQASRASELRAFLTRRFTVSEFEPAYSSLECATITALFTTNIDDLLFRIYANSKTHYLNDLDQRGASFGEKEAIDLITLHGSVVDPSRPYVFNPVQLASAFSHDPDRWHHLTAKLQKYPTLFWGYGLEDSGTLQALDPSASGGRSHKDKWIVLLEGTDSSAVEYFRALSFQIIIGHTKELLEYIGTLRKRTNGASGSRRDTRELFPTEAIPAVGNVPVRPLIDFYLGAAPSWYDIFSGKLHQTKYGQRLRDIVNSSTDCAIVGIPASGKTTLLMQVACDLSFRGHKLFCESITEERAQLILNKLEGDPALVFVDNFTDSIDGFRRLLDAPNLRVVGTDREHNVEIVFHRLDPGKISVLDVTELDDADCQQILESMPPELRVKPAVLHPKVAEGAIPSLFELIESNVVRGNLRRRFSKVLTELGRGDARVADLLLVCCYAHSCRTQVSMDMLLSYFRGLVIDYTEIYKLRTSLGAFVSEYGSYIDDQDQDYYTPRSTFVSEVVMSIASAESLRRMLLRFHSEISPHRIHRFDVFRRQAYDAGLITRAFPDWHEGLEFYKSAHESDRSPYVLQQAALYLSHRKQYVEAFSLIDDAILQSEGRIPSIRNSHAIILFRANINREETDGTVRQTLERSMQILAECYADDRRKLYHVCAYADQALEYFDRFRNQQAKEYIEIAKDWLERETQRYPWHRNAKRLLRAVSRILATKA